MNLLNLFKKEEKVITPEIVNSNNKRKPRTGSRGFKGAVGGRLTNWFLSTFTKINQDLKNNLRQLIIRCRDLAKNNEVFRSHINNIEKYVIGQQGFRLQSLVKVNGELQEDINTELENAWWDFGKRLNGYITKDGEMGDKDFDALILRTLIIDGEVFIKIDRNARNPYGLSFSIIDSLSLEMEYSQEFTPFQNAVIMGIEVDRDYKPINYYIREGNVDNYLVGERIRIPAADVIHIFKKEFASQVRGFPEICASIDSLKQLDDFALAELVGAKVAACQGIFYERNGSVAGDWLDQNNSDMEEKGTFIQELSPGQSSIVPQGYTVKSVTPNHPNSNFNGFVKAIIRKIASSVGVSYNTLAKDYESVNYSSLRQSALDETKTYAELQRFLIENWKEIEYKLFLISYITNNVTTKLKPSKVNDYLSFTFISSKSDYFDPAKDIIAVERKLKLGLTNPIIELEKRGLDVDEVLDGWQIWNKKCKDKNLVFVQDEPVPLDVVNQLNEEAAHPDKIDEE